MSLKNSYIRFNFSPITMKRLFALLLSLTIVVTLAAFVGEYEKSPPVVRTEVSVDVITLELQHYDAELKNSQSSRDSYMQYNQDAITGTFSSKTERTVVKEKFRWCSASDTYKVTTKLSNHGTAKKNRHYIKLIPNASDALRC